MTIKWIDLSPLFMLWFSLTIIILDDSGDNPLPNMLHGVPHGTTHMCICGGAYNVYMLENGVPSVVSTRL